MIKKSLITLILECLNVGPELLNINMLSWCFSLELFPFSVATSHQSILISFWCSFSFKIQRIIVIAANSVQKSTRPNKDMKEKNNKISYYLNIWFFTKIQVIGNQITHYIKNFHN